MNQLIMLLVLFAALFALAYAALNFVLVRKLKEGNERMQEIAAAIREGANAFIRYEYKIVAIIGVVVWTTALWTTDNGELYCNSLYTGPALDAFHVKANRKTLVIICGVLGLKSDRRSMATAALIISIVFLVLAIAYFVFQMLAVVPYLDSIWESVEFYSGTWE